ncbi:helix-turn-helix domain-containing protein [Geomonas nitrogeniifigens]|nr:helix-turn-helix domain-containing protein [Geomonas nitrogeniifigens]
MKSKSFVANFAPGLTLAEARSYTSTALNRAKDALAGKLEIYQGMPVDPRYRFKNQTIIDWLQITSCEERQLKTIISKTEAAERHRQRNRKHTSRANYLAISEDRKCEALELRAKGMSQRQIATALGVSRGAVENYLRK